MKKLTMLVLLASLVGCSDMEVEKPAEKVEAETPVSTPTPTNTATVEQEQIGQYATEATPIMDALTNNLEDIVTLSEIGSSDPSMMLSDEYLETIKLVCDDMLYNTSQFRELDTHGIPQLEDAHLTMLNAISDFEFVAQNFPVAVENLDTDLLGQCVDAMMNSTFFMKEATSKMIEIRRSAF